MTATGPLQVIVSTAAHIPLLKAAFADKLPGAFIPPRITTLGAQLAMLVPDQDRPPRLDAQRVMSCRTKRN